MQIVHKPSKFCIVLFPGIHINDMYFILECFINLLDLSVNMVNRKSISKDIISGNKNHVAFWQLIEVLTGIYSSGRYDNELVIIAAWWINPGQDFDELPESYVIFITRDNILGYGLPIYHIDRQIKEINKAFQDEVHIIYVNSRKQDDTELGRLMHDLHCKRADKMHSPALAKRGTWIERNTERDWAYVPWNGENL